MTVIVEIAELPVGRNVAPDEILPLRVPGRPFSPQTDRVKALDRGVADLGLEALGVDDEDIRVGIALRFGVGAEIATECLRCHYCGGGKRGRGLQYSPSIEFLCCCCGFGLIFLALKLIFHFITSRVAGSGPGCSQNSAANSQSTREFHVPAQ